MVSLKLLLKVFTIEFWITFKIKLEQFRGYFEQFGEIEDSVIMTDKETGKSRGEENNVKVC